MPSRQFVAYLSKQWPLETWVNTPISPNWETSANISKLGDIRLDLQSSTSQQEDGDILVQG